MRGQSNSPRERISKYLMFNKLQMEKHSTSLNHEIDGSNSNDKSSSPRIIPKIKKPLFIKQALKLEPSPSEIIIPETRSIQSVLYSVDHDQEWKPQVTKAGTMVYLNGYCYLYGGRGGRINNSVYQLDLDRLMWKELNCIGDIPDLGRIGHSCVAYKNKFVVFGGQKIYNPKLKKQECTNTAMTFTPHENRWTLLRCFGEFTEARRFHSASMVGKFMVVVGGVNSQGEFIKDVSALNLETLRWQAIYLDQVPESGIAYHAAASIYRGQIIVDSLQGQFDVVNKKEALKQQMIAHEGLYLFGGINSLGQPSNSLTIIQFGSKRARWFEPKTYGQPPGERYQHSITYIPDKMILVVIGGRDDKLHSTGLVEDVKVLLLDSFTWTGVTGITQFIRCLHSAASVDSKILIFGGLQPKYASPELYIFEFDNQRIKTLLKITHNKSEYARLSIDEIISNRELIWMDPLVKFNPFEEERITNQFMLKNFLRQWDCMKYIDHKTYQPLPERDETHIIKNFLVKRFTKNIVRNSSLKAINSRSPTQQEQSATTIDNNYQELNIPTLESLMTKKVRKKIQNKEQLERFVENCVSKIMSQMDQ